MTSLTQAREQAGEHASDATLMAALDGELDAATRAALDAHLGACDACRARDGALRADAVLVRTAVAADAVAHATAPFTWDAVRRRATAEVPGVPRPERVPTGRGPSARVPRAARARRTSASRGGSWGAGWRVAAGLAVMAGVAAAAPAAVRWARGHRGGAPSAADVGVQRRAPAVVAPVADTATTAVEFPLRGDTLTVALDATQRAGAVELVAGDAGAVMARVEMHGARSAARLLVLPGGVRVRNLATGTDSYRVAVPAHVRVVRVEVGPRAPVTVPSARVAAGAVHLPLAPRAP